MIQLNPGNVLLKPSQRRQMMTSLRRATKMGERLGQFVLNLTLRRRGNRYEVIARVQNSAGEFTCNTHKKDWRDAVRDMIHQLVGHLHHLLVARNVPAL